MTSNALYVYLQRPDNGDWVTLGRYTRNDERIGGFRYAPSYERAGLAWSIDPVNLPFDINSERRATRYNGLHDALRDACPDAWGRLVISREHGLPANADDLRYLTLAGNGDRWGALAVGASKTPSLAHLNAPRLPQLEELAAELLALSERRGPVNAKLRKRLVATSSLGGARPKATVQDGDQSWLVKPILSTDIADIPLLEHFAQSWGRASGLNFARTVHHSLSNGVSVVRVLRFDRHAHRRIMALSGASLLQTEYPGGPSEAGKWSYPRLAEVLKQIGAPVEDRQELFGRMVFNAVVGNDDDHPRNHAVIYRHDEKCWRLAPAFDVVPNPDDTPRRLAMQLSVARYDISRDSVLADAIRFGFDEREAATTYLNALLGHIESAFSTLQNLLGQQLRMMMAERLAANMQALAHIT